MQPMMQAPPPSMPPQGPPPVPPPSGSGHGPFSEEEIQQMMADTGMGYEQVCAAIDQTGGTSKEQVFPNIYQGTGIQPQAPPDGQMASDGAVQGQPPAVPGPEGMAPPPMAPPMAAEGAMPESGTVEGIDPAVAQKLHAAMAPRSPKYKRPR